MIDDWPTAADIERYAAEHGLAFEDITRDIVRIASIAHLAGKGVLNDRFVLVGGMALRLRGSNRFTIKDTDSSLDGVLDEIAFAGDLGMEEPALEIYPDDGTNWKRKTPKLVDIKPIAYNAYFASATDEPVQGEFSFTVSTRGLMRPADWLVLRHPYPELVLQDDQLLVPVMNIAEQAAEKVVAWAAHSLVKHYLDLAWIGERVGSTMNREDLQKLVQAKLDVGYATYPDSYAKLRSLQDLILPLSKPRDHTGPLGRAGDQGFGAVRFMGPKRSYDEARALVVGQIIPALFDLRQPTRG